MEELTQYKHVYKHFDIKQCASPDLIGSEAEMHTTLLNKLEMLGSLSGVKLKINSGFRTKEHNKKVGGKSDSSHMYGWAVDIHCTTSRERYLLLHHAIYLGFSRIGIYHTFLHLDTDIRKSSRVAWIG